MLLNLLSLFGGGDDYYGGNPYGGGHQMASAASMGVAALVEIILGLVVALVLTILLYVLVFPEKRKNTLNSFFTFVRNFFGIKYLIIEKILKFFYVLNTMTTICVGFFLLFGRTFFLGLLMIILGPIIHRLSYESIMLIILLVKNTIEINNKLEDKNGSGESSFDGGFPKFDKKPSAGFGATQYAQAAPQQAYAQPEQTYVQPEAQQTYVQPEAPAQATPAVCPNCGTPIEEGAIFCAGCGTKIG